MVKDLNLTICNKCGVVDKQTKIHLFLNAAAFLIKRWSI